MDMWRWQDDDTSFSFRFYVKYGHMGHCFHSVCRVQDRSSDHFINYSISAQKDMFRDSIGSTRVIGSSLLRFGSKGVWMLLTSFWYPDTRLCANFTRRCLNYIEDGNTPSCSSLFFYTKHLARGCLSDLNSEVWISWEKQIRISLIKIKQWWKWGKT